MRRRSRSLALAGCLLLLASSARGQDRTLIVGVYENAPKVFVDEAGEPAGLFLDILRAIAEEEGWELVYRPGTWTEGLDRLARGEIDLMPDVAHNAAREALYGFPEEPVLSSWFQVYARKGAGVRSLVDLAGKRVVVLESSVQQAAFEDLIAEFKLTVDVQPLQDYGDMFQRVSAGTADAAITNNYYGLRHAKRYGLEDTAIIFHPTQLHFATPRGKHEDLRQVIAAHLRRMKADPSSIYYASLKRWTTEGATFFVPSWIKYAGLAASTALLGTLLCSAWLKRQVDQRTRALRASERRLEQAQRLEAIGRLAGGVAHDFNNMLSVILGYSELLLYDPLPEATRRTVVRIKEAGERASLLTRQLLALGRGQVLHPEVLDPNQQLREMSDLIRSLVGGEHELVIALRPETGRVKADPGQLQQILMNLVVNSRDAMPGGGTLTIETANVVLDEDYARGHPDAQAGPHVRLSVKDTGQGIDARTQAHLFEPFYTTKERGKGTGLGLATVYGIVKQSGGHVRVDSELGRGTTFEVYLPRVDEAAGESAEAPPPPAPRSGAAATVLVVDDQPDLRELFRTVLEGDGYRVLSAADTAEGLSVYEEHAGRVDLLVTDVVVPTLGGAELAGALLRRDPALRVLYTSGNAADAVVRQDRLGPRVELVGKPILPLDLRKKVRELLGDGRATRGDGQDPPQP